MTSRAWRSMTQSRHQRAPGTSSYSPYIRKRAGASPPLPGHVRTCTHSWRYWDYGSWAYTQPRR
eukprot:3209751-Pleurochrysis_carterae.AAC.1